MTCFSSSNRSQDRLDLVQGAMLGAGDLGGFPALEQPQMPHHAGLFLAEKMLHQRHQFVADGGPIIRGTGQPPGHVDIDRRNMRIIAEFASPHRS